MRVRALFALGSSFLGACASTDLDVRDEGAFYATARVRKELDDLGPHEGRHVEAAWTTAHSDSRELDATIGAAFAGIGTETHVRERLWAGAVGGLTWQHAELDAAAGDVDARDGLGPYAALQAGWAVTGALELRARVQLAMYLRDFDVTSSAELGPRFTFTEHASLFAGWRYATYELRDLGDLLSIEEVELDASGVALELQFAF